MKVLILSWKKIINVVDYITNNEYENLKNLVEEKFTAEEFQIIGENK